MIILIWNNEQCARTFESVANAQVFISENGIIDYSLYELGKKIYA